MLVVAYFLRHEAWTARKRFLSEIGEGMGDFVWFHLVTLALPVGWSVLIANITMSEWGTLNPILFFQSLWSFPAYHAAGLLLASIIPSVTDISWFWIYSSSSVAKELARLPQLGAKTFVSP